MNYKANLNFENLISKSIPNLTPPKEHPKPKYDFGVAYPDPESIPVAELINSLSTGLEEEGKELAFYPHPDGYPPLRKFVSKKLSQDRNIDVRPEQIVLTDGSLESIYMVSEVLIDNGDVVLTEKYTYSGTLRIFNRFRAEVIGVECDQSGIIPSDLEKQIKAIKASSKKIKLLYTIPTFQNPLGFSLPESRRLELLSITQKFQIPILEDDCYVDLNYEDNSYPSIYSLDTSKSVIYVGSFSKIIGPGTRMGYVVAPDKMLDKIRIVKSGGGVNQFAALAIHRFAVTGLSSHISKINDILCRKRDAMLAALGENFGSQGTWNNPGGGLYIWLQMPEGADVAGALPAALEADVGYQPGTVFSPDGASGANYARLCYGYNTIGEIHEGIGRLAEVFDHVGILG